MAALPEQDVEQRFPEPLEFFLADAIHPDNQAVIEQEARRWRLLGFWERLKLKRYVASLARELQRGGYNPKLRRYYKLGARFKAERQSYRTTTYINESAKASARAKLLKMRDEGWKLKRAIDELKPTFELWQHYQGWIDYERGHRRDLKAEDKRERKNRAEMRKEAKWLEKLIVDVWRKTDGCHYTHTNDGKEKTQCPKIERSTIQPDAHWFYLKASRHLLWSHKWCLPNGVSIERLMEDDVIKNLCAATKRQVDAVWSETGQLIFRVSRLDSPDALPRLVKWRDTMKYFPELDADKLPYCIGVADNRKFRWFNFAKEPHVLIAGKSQSGKSNLANGIIATLVTTHTPKALRVVLIDQKGGVEFTFWKELPHLLWEMVKTIDEVQPVLQRLVAIMHRRMATLESVKAKDIGAYNARVDADHQMERILLAIDEMNTFVGLKSLTDDIHNLIMLLVSQGRAVGVHVILATQHPEVAVIPGRIKTNMSVRLSGSMPTISASQIILDNPEAARLPSLPGRFVAVVGLETLKVQVPRIEDQEITDIVASLRKQYPDVSNDISDMADRPALVIWNEQRVLKAAIEWLEGHLSAQRLHKMLGSEESPGERHLAKMCRRIIDEYEAIGFVELAEKGSQWTIRKKGKAYHLEERKDRTDRTDEKMGTKEPDIVSDPTPDRISKRRRYRIRPGTNHRSPHPFTAV